MDFFLPVAQVQVTIWIILLLSFIVGIISGLFGIGGGFLMTPVLIFLGIPPTYAVANEANNILGTSVSGALHHWFRKTLDYKMGITIVAGGVVGTGVGMLIFAYLREKGVINVSITLAYIYMLVIIGTLMFAKGYKELTDLRKKIVIKRKAHDHYWIHGLPFRMKFHKSRLRKRISADHVRIYCWNICINYGCWWGFNGSCNDLYYWYANKISS